MKYLYPLSLMLVLLASCGKDEEKTIDPGKTDWAAYDLTGNVKTVSEKSYSTLDGKQKGPSKHEKSSDHDTDLTFNEEGMLIKEKKWTADAEPFEEITYKGKDFRISQQQYTGGSPSLNTTYVWDETGKNNLSVVRRNADNSLFDKVVMKYKNSRLIERIVYNHDEIQSDKVQYLYDGKGNLTHETVYKSDDVAQDKYEYAYNNKNQKISETHYDKNGKKDYETRYTYQGDKLVATETYNAKGELSYVEKQAYDKKGNLLNNYSFDKFDGLHMRDVYEYDDKGNKTGWNVLEGETLKMRTNYGFDEKGNMTKLLSADADGNVVESKIYKYDYDKKGNWIKRLIIVNDRPLIITERTITYFDEE